MEQEDGTEGRGAILEEEDPDRESGKHRGPFEISDGPFKGVMVIPIGFFRRPEILRDEPGPPPKQDGGSKP
jgi:hypothetical protein